MYPFFEAQASILFNMSSEQKAYCPAKFITCTVAEIKKCDMRGSHAGEHTQHAFVAVRCAVDSEFISVRYGAAAVRLKYHENVGRTSENKPRIWSSSLYSSISRNSSAAISTETCQLSITS